jgi:myo-inositol 2-dehydrogenase / D-chiro-inositol 1-dehydrogenase
MSTARRDFVKAAGGGLLILKPETVFGTAQNSAVEVGLVGCGGRGNWIAPFFIEYTGARVVALADVMKENLNSTAAKFKVDAGRSYYGPDAYQELANSQVDAVVIESPPIYHAPHIKAAVDAGKHVYFAKPVAVDVPSCLSVLASGKKAEGKRSFWADFQSRAQPVFQEAVERVRRGDIGKPAFVQSYYHGGRLGNRAKPGMDPEQARLLNFYSDPVLGGEFIVEQSIHVIDMANWYLGAHPVRAVGTGGRTDWSGTSWADVPGWDHYIVTFWYPGGVKVDFSSTQLARGFGDLCVRCFGLKGVLDSHYGGLVRITGEKAWMGAEKDDTFKQGAINNVKAFIESIRTGKLINNAEQAVESTLTAIFGRTAAHAKGPVTWDELMKSTERLEANLKLRY